MAAKDLQNVVKWSAADYLRQPYMRSVVPQSDGSYHAEIIELPGCIATGDTAAKALEHLEDVAISWIESALDANQAIPSAMEQNDFSGKMIVRMPRSLHRKASFMAERDGVSLNQFIVSCVAEGVGLTTRGAARTAGNVYNLQLAVLPVMMGTTAGPFDPHMVLGKQYAGN